MAIDAGRATMCRRIFKAPWLQTERTKNEGPSKKMCFNGETVWRFQTKKFKNSLPPKENKKTTTPQGRQLNLSQVATTKLSEAKLKKAFRIKLFELCKTTAKQSIPDLFNSLNSRLVMTCWTTLAGLPSADANWRPHDYKQKVRKMKGLLRKWVLTENSLKISNQKNRKIQWPHGKQNKRTTRPQGQNLNMNHVARKKLIEAKLKKKHSE